MPQFDPATLTPQVIAKMPVDDLVECLSMTEYQIDAAEASLARLRPMHAALSDALTRAAQAVRVA